MSKGIIVVTESTFISHLTFTLSQLCLWSYLKYNIYTNLSMQSVKYWDIWKEQHQLFDEIIVPQKLTILTHTHGHLSALV